MQRKARSHLTRDERCQIHALLQVGMSLRRIATSIQVHHSTVVRELQRNTGLRGYRPKQASELAIERRHTASHTARRLCGNTISLITEMLTANKASPVQISGRLKKTHNIHISAESIYRFIKEDRKTGGILYKSLRRRHKKYNRRLGKKAGRGCIPGRIDISERPKEVENKTRVGDIELDTIVGVKHRGAIVSMVDRASKYVWLRLVSAGTAQHVKDAILEALGSLKSGTICTLTSDNGKEFSAHKEITSVLGATVYFATPYHSWERGLNEHTNGLVCQYFPKGTDFTTITEAQVRAVQDALNTRPRKVLDFDTPKERLERLLKSLSEQESSLRGGAFQS